MRSHRLLNTLILGALVLGLGLGLYLYFHFSGQVEAGAITADDVSQRIAWMQQVGDLVLVRPLKMLIIPLIFASVVVGITSIGNPSRLGVLGGLTLGYYFSTMLLAVVLGAVLVTMVQPGAGLDSTGEAFAQVAQGRVSGELQQNLEQRQQEGLTGAWMNILRQMIPTNAIAAAAEGQPLPIITFSMLFGLAISVAGRKADPVRRFMEALFEVVMIMVHWIIWLAPIGVFFLIAWSVARMGGELVSALGKYMLTVAAGLTIHSFLVLPLILFLFARVNPYAFLWAMRPALLTAFGTASSSATLPLTMETAETDGGCSKKASGFVLPLGSTINMDGTALYEAVAVVFLFQAFGIQLGMEQLAIVVLTATLAAIGAAGIPSAGLVTMVIVIQAVNTSLEGQGVPALPLFAIGFILGVDRILDMYRTAVNVWGDAVGARMLTRLAPDDPVASDDDPASSGDSGSERGAASSRSSAVAATKTSVDASGSPIRIH